jgi:type IV secretion system protein VirB10
MLVGGGGGGGVGSIGGGTSVPPAAGSDAAAGSKDATKTVKLSDDVYFVPERTPAAQQRITRVGEMSYIIAQGKIIDAVLETAMNSDFPGVVRAIVSRDVYAEAGKAVMIQKGSRLVGDYSAATTQGQQRVNIIWKRLIRPDGIDIIINSGVVDKLGRSALAGIVDNKYFEVMSNAVLLSIINISAAKSADRITNAQPTTTITTLPSAGGSTTTQTGTATDTAVQDAMKNFSDTNKQLMQNAVKLTPTIYVDQGTVIKIFVNKDIVFPSNISTNQGVLN